MKLPRWFHSTRRLASFGSILMLAALGSMVAIGQSTNAPTELPASMEYPTNNLALLPGKGPIPAWKGFYPLWTKRRLEFMRHSSEDKGAVVFLGDSITQGWNSV